MASGKNVGKEATAAEVMTEVVYVCSSDWQHVLFTSMRSLLASGTSFDRLTILCVGRRPRHWIFADPRIVVEEVESLDSHYFMINKIYLARRKAERLIFLDADTMVMKPLDEVWARVESDFCARVASSYGASGWNQGEWLEALERVSAPEVPYFNCGFVVFQNGAHRKLDGVWLKLTREIMAGKMMQSIHSKFAEQVALSLAIGSAGLSCHHLRENEHRYGWLNEPCEDAMVYHTSNFYFQEMATAIEDMLGIADLDLPVFSGSGWMNPVKLGRRLRRMRVAFLKR